ncbi:MAG: DNA-deoxyinosine glycosylase [Clostridia bacterium]|nr:DNA-deoxyinosine glycosylase [Clostridia bacterium]NLS84065.1 DNA-deoxyinosine glycosylase [Oscillospiraceae bacterium]
MPFEPVYNENSKILIVGTWPSPLSRANGFYYGNPQNRFWGLLARLFNAETPTTIDEKKQLILSNGLALWDTLQSCEIRGASDASICNEVPSDIAGLCRKAPIQRVLCNGAKAYQLYTKFQKGCPPAVKLPSTSPANAACNKDMLYEQWHKELYKEEYFDEK